MAERETGGGLAPWLALGALVVGLVYLCNLGGGGRELIPDSVPLWGNLDELAAAALVILGLRRLFAGRSK